jgi:hypothetical protein
MARRWAPLSEVPTSTLRRNPLSLEALLVRDARRRVGIQGRRRGAMALSYRVRSNKRLQRTPASGRR